MNHTEKVAFETDRFDGLANGEGLMLDRYTSPSPSRKAELDNFLAFAGLPSGQLDILDIGCGRGNYAIPLMQLGHRLTCVDVSINSLQIMLDTVTELGLLNNLSEIFPGDFLSWAGGYKYDAIIGGAVIHHICDCADSITTLFGKISGMLKDGGMVVMKEPNPVFPYRLYYLFTPSMNWQQESGIQYSTKKNIRKAARDSGLSDIRFRNTGLFPFADRSHLIFKINRWLDRSLLIELISQEFMFSATKTGGGVLNANREERTVSGLVRMFWES